MANEYVNKVVYGDDTLIDLTGDTVSPETLSRGVTAHNAAGEQIAGVFDGVDTSDADAVASDILDGKTAYVKGKKVLGSMPDESNWQASLDASKTKVTIPKGYHSGEKQVWVNYMSSDAFTPTKGKQTRRYNVFPKEITVNPIPDEYITTTDADATAADILDGKTAYVDGEKITGTLEAGIKVVYLTKEFDYSSLQSSYANIDVGGLVGSLSNITSGTFEDARSAIEGGGLAFLRVIVTSDGSEIKRLDLPLSIISSTVLASEKIENFISPNYTYEANVRRTSESTDNPHSLLSVLGKTAVVDTADANAVAAEIVNNKTAYVNGSKITGTLVPLDTSDADATAADILDGKTAYVNGEKLTGTAQSIVPYEINVNLEDLTYSEYTALHKRGQKILAVGTYAAAKNAFDNNAKVILNVYQSGEKIAICGLLNHYNNDLYGSVAGILNGALTRGYADLFDSDIIIIDILVVNDTSNATATAADILDGKTAYVQGVEITGTLQNASGVSF